MVSIQNITQKKVLYKSLIFTSVLVFIFLLSALSVLASSDGLTTFDTMMLGLALGVGGFVAGLGGILFDLAINYFALEMGSWFVDRGVGAVVTSIWTMIRDLFNILFIFTLVYIGLRTILDSDDSKTKKMLGMLIVAALLINFSLYIAKVVVDVSNFTTVQIYDTATKGIEGQFGLSFTINKKLTSITGAEKSLSGAYMQVLSVSSWFDDEVASAGNTLVYSILSLFFLVFLGLVLAYGAIMLIARFIAIIFYLMFSPFMFLGWILPQFQSYATKWWKGFLGYSFFAPVYIFMLYIGLFSLQQIRNGLNDAANSSFSKPFAEGTFSVGNFEIFLLFAVGVGFLMGATKVASVMSQGGAAIGMGAMDKFSRKVTTGFGHYGAAYSASAATGWAARGVGNYMDKRSAASGKSRSRMGRMVRSGVLKGETAKFGGSQSSKERGDDDKAEKKRHSGVHGAYETIQTITNSKDTVEKEAAIAGASDSTLVEMTNTSEGREALYAASGSLKDSQIQALLKSDDVAPGVKIELKEKRQDHIRKRVSESENGTIQDGLKNASTAQLTSLDFKDDLMNNAMYLQDGQMEDLKKKWDDNETFRLLKEKREKQMKDTVKKGNIGKLIDTRKNPKEIAKLPNNILEDPDAIKHLKTKLSADMLKTFSRESKADKRKIGKNVLKTFGDFGSLPVDIQNYFKSGDGVIYGVTDKSNTKKYAPDQTSGFNSVSKAGSSKDYWKTNNKS